MDGITDWQNVNHLGDTLQAGRENKNRLVSQQHSYTSEMPPNGQPLFTSGLSENTQWP